MPGVDERVSRFPPRFPQLILRVRILGFSPRCRHRDAGCRRCLVQGRLLQQSHNELVIGSSRSLPTELQFRICHLIPPRVCVETPTAKDFSIEVCRIDLPVPSTRVMNVVSAVAPRKENEHDVYDYRREQHHGHTSAKRAAAVEGAEHFRNEAGLTKLAANWPIARLVEIWNTLPGVAPVKISRIVLRAWRGSGGDPGFRPGFANGRQH